ncbi:MAG: hypothetical protein WCP52_00145 [Bacteroidota bacterium]
MEQNKQTVRVLEVFNFLLKKEKVEGVDDFCRKCEFNASAFSQIRTKNRNAPLSLQHKIIKAFNVNPDFIFDGLEPMFTGDISSKTKSNVKQIDSDNDVRNCIIVPLKAYGGFLKGYENSVYLDSLERVSCPEIKGTCFRFEVEDFSMFKSANDRDSFVPGDKVTTTPMNGFNELRAGKPYVFITVGGIILKEFVKIEGEYCHLRSYNPEYPVKPIHLKKIKMLLYIDLVTYKR